MFSAAERAQMEVDIAAARAARLAGVVLGASPPDGAAGPAALTRLIAAAKGRDRAMDCTLHRAFDARSRRGTGASHRGRFFAHPDPGGARTAETGADRLAALVAQARGRISVMPGSGIAPANAARFVAMGITELHGSWALPHGVAGPAVDLASPATERRTDAATVRRLRDCLR